MAGKFVFVFVSDDTGNCPNYIYVADLEKNGEIKGKITLEPIINVDRSNVFEVSRTTNI